MSSNSKAYGLEGVDTGGTITAKTNNAAGTLSAPLQTALKLPNGARFYRCALQVNPFAYLSRHNKQTVFPHGRGIQRGHYRGLPRSRNRGHRRY